MTLDLQQTLNRSPVSFYFLVVDNYLDINLYPQLANFHLIYAYKNQKLDQFKQSNTPYLCLEEIGEYLQEKNSGKLLSHPKVLEYIHNTSSNSNTTPAIIPFKPSAKIDFICKTNNWINISNPSSINRLLEDKIKFPEICQQYHINTIPFLIDKFNEISFTKAQKKFGQHLVIQTHFGWAGNSTFQASNWEEACTQLEANISVKYSPYLQGYSLLNNCCLTKYGLIQSPPALQYTGLKSLTVNPFATVGRQWPSLAPTDIQEQINLITTNVSQILKDINYKGFFGLDFLVSNNEVFLLECNPRLTASFAFYTQMELNQNLTPLFYFHLLDFLNLSYSIDIVKEQSRSKNNNLIGSEVILKDDQNNTINKHNDFTIFSPTINPITINSDVINKLTSKSA